ncbi:hypothetical protein ACOSP7_016612 [Xanthoceras sorbifolium]
MKRMEIFCASPSSTAICSSSMVVNRGHHRPSLDGRGNHHHRYRRPIMDRRYAPPCNSSHLPIIPRPSSSAYSNYHEKISSRKTSSSSAAATKQQISDSSSTSYLRRKSSADVVTDLTSSPPAGSSRYLLSDRPFIDWLSDSDHHHNHHHDDASSALVPSSNTSTQTSKSPEQVVVLRVSIHCKGCEGKVRKHISKMEGVRSFSIDIATKKVTVIGNVTTLGVLASVSRVKKAQLWPSSSSTSPSLVNMSY